MRAALALHMGLMLYLFYDPTPDARATYKLADQAADVLTMLGSPVGKTLAAPFLARIETALRDAAILPGEHQP